MLATLPRALVLCTSVLLLFGASQAGASTLTIDNSIVGGVPLGATHVNFDNLPLNSTGGNSGGIAVTFTPDGQAVQGTTGQYAAPYLSNSNGALFGDPNNGPDATTYLTSGSNGSVANAKVTLTFSGPEQYFGLLWGSVDTYNTLSFFDQFGNLIGSITGSQVTPSATGDQGVNGTYYVNINSATPFYSVVASSTQYAFEFDNVSYNLTPEAPATAPLPGALALFSGGLGILALSGLRRRRNTRRDPSSMAIA
jgi:hypothetical protein